MSSILLRLRLYSQTPLGAAPMGAPLLAITSDPNDATPVFYLQGEVQDDDVVRLQWDTDPTFASAIATTGTISGEGLTLVTGTLADATWYFRARIERPLYQPSAWSDFEVETIDATAPTLSSPSGTQTGATTADLSASTDEANGWLYVVVTESATPPTGAQIIAGTDDGDAAAAFADLQSVIATGTQTLPGATGLTTATTYYAHYVHEDLAGNLSNVATSAGFTTA